jgi:uncharacterized protein YjiS (DUF1127 family)
MTRFTEFEKALVGRAKTPARPVALQGFARIAAFGRALGVHYKHAAIEAQAARDLQRLSDRMLADIGLTRGDIDRVAKLTANQTQPVERSLAAETGSFLYDLLLRPVVRFVRKRRAYASLMALDDRMLRDIGIDREDIPALVKRLSGDRPQLIETEAETVAGAETAPSFGVWNRYRATARELGQLDNHMLADIGFVRGDIDWIAEELAVRSFRGTANANSAPRAA